MIKPASGSLRLLGCCCCWLSAFLGPSLCGNSPAMKGPRDLAFRSSGAQLRKNIDRVNVTRRIRQRCRTTTSSTSTRCHRDQFRVASYQHEVSTREMYVDGEMKIKDILLRVSRWLLSGGRVVGPPLISVGANVRLVKMNFHRKRHFIWIEEVLPGWGPNLNWGKELIYIGFGGLMVCVLLVCNLFHFNIYSFIHFVFM